MHKGGKHTFTFLSGRTIFMNYLLAAMAEARMHCEGEGEGDASPSHLVYPLKGVEKKLTFSLLLSFPVRFSLFFLTSLICPM
jgi:hypothetical protein